MPATTAVAILSVRISSRDTLHFYEAAFGARLVFVTPDDGPAVHHAELTIGGAMFMCGTGQEEGLDVQLGGASSYWVLQAGAEVDAIFQQAVAAGATEVFAPHDADYGGRHCTVRDPDGNAWSFGTYRPEGI